MQSSWTVALLLFLVLLITPRLLEATRSSPDSKPSAAAFLRNDYWHHPSSRPRRRLCERRRTFPRDDASVVFHRTTTSMPLFFSNRIQISAVHSFWSVATRIGMRRLGDCLKRWYPSAYGDSIFYFEEEEETTGPRRIALTIDDGLFRGNTTAASSDGDHEDEDASQQSPMISEVCELLRSYGARATVFVCTDYTTQQQAQEVLREGHELGNHLKDDKSGYYCKLVEDDFARELDDTNRILEAMLIPQEEGDVGDAKDSSTDDHHIIRWFRAPQGVMSRAMCKTLRNRRMVNVMGDCYCDDWAFAEKAQSTSGVVAPLMLRQVQDGSIAIFHMPQRNFRESTLDALREFLQGMQTRNIKCVTVSEMMDN